MTPLVMLVVGIVLYLMSGEIPSPAGALARVLGAVLAVVGGVLVIVGLLGGV